MNIKGLNLHQGQKRLVKEIFENKDAKYHVINTSRQTGKTVLISQLLLYYSINNKKTVSWYCAPIHSVAKRMYKFIFNAIKNSPVLLYANKTDMELELFNGSTIKFTGVDKYDNLRGGSVSYFFLDEFAFYREEVWNEALKQMMAVRGRKAFFVSTPNGKHNLFYNFSKLGQSSENERYDYHFATFRENPYYDKAEVDDAKKTLPDFIYRQEYEAEFIDLGVELFQNLDLVSKDIKFKGNGPYYAGLDLGRQNDYTVLTIVDKDNKVIDWYRDNQKSWELMVNNVVNMLKKYNCPVLVEVNSIGDVVFEMIKKQWNKSYAFHTTGESKNPLIENMLIHFQNSDILIPSKKIYKELHEEIATYIVEYTASKRSFKYTHAVGFHDDCVDSLALSLLCKKTKQNIGVHFI